MNSINGNILVGAIGSKARFDNSGYKCRKCLIEHGKPDRQVMPMGEGICEVCENEVERIYILI